MAAPAVPKAPSSSSSASPTPRTWRAAPPRRWAEHPLALRAAGRVGVSWKTRFRFRRHLHLSDGRQVNCALTPCAVASRHGPRRRPGPLGPDRHRLRAGLTRRPRPPGAAKMAGMLSKLDDYPVHQTVLPLATPNTTDRHSYDRYWFNGYDREGDFYFGIAMCRYPNLGILDCGFSIVRGGEQHAFHGSRRMPPGADRPDGRPLRPPDPRADGPHPAGARRQRDRHRRRPHVHAEDGGGGGGAPDAGPRRPRSSSTPPASPSGGTGTGRSPTAART